METDKLINTKRGYKKGAAWNGNRLGRPRRPEVEELRRALELAKTETGVHFLEHFVRRAYKNDNVAIALAKKLIPDKIEGINSVNIGQYIVIRHPMAEKEENDNSTISATAEQTSQADVQTG